MNSNNKEIIVRTTPLTNWEIALELVRLEVDAKKDNVFIGRTAGDVFLEYLELVAKTKRL